MKKLLAVMLAMIMVLSLLAGCGSKSSKKNNNKDDDDDDDKKKESTSDVSDDTGNGNKDDDTKDDTNDDTNLGLDLDALLDQPEKTFDLNAYNEVYISYTKEFDEKESTTDIAIVKDGTTTVYYYVYDGETTIVEESSEGIAGYVKKEGSNEFESGNKFGQDYWETIKRRVDAEMKHFTDWQALYNDNHKLRKTNKIVANYTSRAAVYEVIMNGTVRGTLHVDDATGLIVYTTDNNLAYTVKSFKTSGVQLPAYK